MTVNPREAGKVREHAKPGQSEKTAWRRQVSGPKEAGRPPVAGGEQ